MPSASVITAIRVKMFDPLFGRGLRGNQLVESDYRGVFVFVNEETSDAAATSWKQFRHFPGWLCDPKRESFIFDLFDIDLHRVGRFSIRRQNDLHLATPGQIE